MMTKLMGEYNKQYFKASRKFQKDPVRLNFLLNCILNLRPTHVLDVGCGIGYLVFELNQAGVPTIGVDSAKDLRQFWGPQPYFQLIETACVLPFADKSFDLVISTDFFEHVPEDLIATVYAEMQRVGNRVAASIAYEDKLTKRQAMYHVTNKPKDWWDKKLPNITLL